MTSRGRDFLKRHGNNDIDAGLHARPAVMTGPMPSVSSERRRRQPGYLYD